MNIRYLIVMFMLAFTASCSDGGNNENAFQTQIDAVDKANEVEGKILDAASQQQQAIDETTR